MRGGGGGVNRRFMVSKKGKINQPGITPGW